MDLEKQHDITQVVTEVSHCYHNDVSGGEKKERTSTS